MTTTQATNLFTYLASELLKLSQLINCVGANNVALHKEVQS